jgi:gluconate 5-dehydrogenase
MSLKKKEGGFMETYGKVGDLFSVKGKTAVITGGTSGLGKAVAIGLLENDCDVFLVSRRRNGCEDIIEFAEQTGRTCIHCSCDVTKSDEVADTISRVHAASGKIDILVNSAGMNILKFIDELDNADWDSVINTNLTAVFYVIRAVSKIMKGQGGGRIINISSVKGFLGTSDFGYSAYCASKGAINMLTKQVACELAKYHITCNAIAPTFIKTAINEKMLENETFRKELEARIPLGRIGRSGDLVNLSLYLASDASDFITGQTILLDGGILARQ